jgi:peptidoglycan/LPS O-acetylase OafA/YrhL
MTAITCDTACPARLLRGNDAFYGIYLFHMLIVNVLVEAGIVGHVWLLPVVMLGAVGVGWVSWKALEQPMLRLKRSPAKLVVSDGGTT